MRGEPLLQETRGWDDDRGVTYHMRTKETSDDYRYFPEPDLPPLRLDTAWLDEIRAALPELLAARRRRYREELGFSAYDADVLASDGAAAAVFEAAREADPDLPAKKLANWVSGEFLRLAKGEDAEVDVSRISGPHLAVLVRLVEDGQISGTNARRCCCGSARVAQVATSWPRRLPPISDTDACRPKRGPGSAENVRAADVAPRAERRSGFRTPGRS